MGEGGKGSEQRWGGSSVFQTLVRGGSSNFKLPMGVGHPFYYWITGIGILVVSKERGLSIIECLALL